MTSRETWIPWTEEDSAKLFRMGSRYKRISAAGWEYIGSCFPTRSIVACKQQYGKLKAKAEGRVVRQYRPRDRADPNSRRVQHLPEEKILRQNPLVLPQPKSITAWICGDPLPGRSALDRKMEGMAP